MLELSVSCTTVPTQVVGWLIVKSATGACENPFVETRKLSPVIPSISNFFFIVLRFCFWFICFGLCIKSLLFNSLIVNYPFGDGQLSTYFKKTAKVIFFVTWSLNFQELSFQQRCKQACGHR